MSRGQLRHGCPAAADAHRMANLSIIRRMCHPRPASRHSAPPARRLTPRAAGDWRRHGIRPFFTRHTMPCPAPYDVFCRTIAPRLRGMRTAGGGRKALISTHRGNAPSPIYDNFALAGGLCPRARTESLQIFFARKFGRMQTIPYLCIHKIRIKRIGLVAQLVRATDS